MDLSSLGSPAELWRRWTLVAAEHAARGLDGAEVRRADGCGHVTASDGSWLRMRRLVGDRAVVWGDHAGRSGGPALERELRDAAPDWAVGATLDVTTTGFLGWHAHGRWWSVPTPVPDAVAALLAPLASEEAILERWRGVWPDAGELALRTVVRDPDRAGFSRLAGAAAGRRAVRQVERARTGSASRLSETAATHLRSQVHTQMHAVGELADRGLPPRPPLLRQWARVQGGRMPFRRAIGWLGGPLAPDPVGSRDDNGLTTTQRTTLDNVLTELRAAERVAVSGAWLFARVTGDGRVVRLERAFDSWPWWYDGPGPGLGALAQEMAGRDAAWRPAWAGLLPG